MAAGMGSRYGGLKQLEPVGPNNETIIDFSVYDAIQTGFNKIVFIIRKDFEKEFKEKISNKYKNKIKIDFAFQDLDALPNHYKRPEGRIKPWGTGHAILAASHMINDPFVVINGDDFYGRSSFQVVADYYINGGTGFSMVAFQLDKTLSEFGGVTRGICAVNKNELKTVVETSNIQHSTNQITSDRTISLCGDEPVSMNMWGFTPTLFNQLNARFVSFLKEKGQEMKSEFLIPTVVNELVGSNEAKVHVLRSDSRWFGITYKEDTPHVQNQILDLVNKGLYPTSLF